VTSTAASTPLLDRPGAVPGDGIDAAVALHYGDPLGEQRRSATGPVVVDRSHRGVVRVTGPDRLSWLHSLLSQSLSDLRPGESREALLLSPHGHVEQHMVVTEDGQATWIDLEPAQAPGFVDYLESMRFMLRVEVADVTDGIAVLTVFGTGDGSVVAFSDVVVDRMLGWGRDLLVARGAVADLVAGFEEGGVTLVGHGAFEAARVAARRPRFGFETDHRTIPHEVGWIGAAVHLDKGCYRGQETVARVENLGRPPRRLVLGHLDGSAEQPPAAGTPVELDGRTVGVAGTVVWHAELGQVGLALVKRQLPDDAHLVVGDQAFAIDPS
jgi:folate-binding protein YgfZ